MERDLVRVRARNTKRAHRETADRARDAIAIKIELGEARRLDWRARIHFHAINQRTEIVAPEAKARRILRKDAAERRLAGSGENRIDFAAPFIERDALVLLRLVAVGDVADLAAESVDRIHRIAPRLG